MFKGKLKIDALLDIPLDLFNSNVSVRYILGYYVGTSYRVLCQCSSYQDCVRIRDSYLECTKGVSKKNKSDFTLIRCQISLDRVDYE